MTVKSTDEPVCPERIIHPLSDELISAAARDDVQACIRLIEQGADCRFPGSDGTTPAEVAARAGHLYCLDLLLCSGLAEAWRYSTIEHDGQVEVDGEVDGEVEVDGDSATYKEAFDGGEALRAAALAGKTSAATLILSVGVDVDSADAQGRTALHLAALYDNPDTVAALIEEEADVHLADVEGRTPLHLARLSHSIQCARLLLAAGANPKALDKKKKTPAALAGQAKRTAEAMRSRFLFYIGAKSELLDAIVEMIPWNAERLIEPFVGSGAATAGLAFRFHHVDASDANPDIVSALKTAAEEPDALIAELRSIFGPELPTGIKISEQLESAERDYYKDCLDEFNDRSRPISSIRRSALYIYLNRMGFKGLQRKNKKKQEFSVPFWKDRIGQSSPESQIREFYERLHGKSSFRVRDFKDAFAGAGIRDFLYLDPPYLPSEGKKVTHTGYAGTEFLEEHHAMLADLARKAADDGATVVVSNHDSIRIRELYASANEFRSLKVLRGMSHGKDKQEEVDELLVVWKPPFVAIIETFDRPVDPVEALDPFGGTLPLATLDRIAWWAAKRNHWLKDGNADIHNITFQSFKKAGAQLLTIARHGTYTARQLVFGRQGREKLLGLEFLAEVVMAMKNGDVTFDQAEQFFEGVLATAKGIEAFVPDKRIRDDILRRCLKTKLKILLNPDGDGERTLIRKHLAKRYGYAAAVMMGRRWTANSEPGGRLLLLAERCIPRDTKAFSNLCEAIIKTPVKEKDFLEKFPAVKTGPARGVGVQGHSDLCAADLYIL